MPGILDVRRAGQHHREFVAAEACGETAVRDRVAQAFSDGFQNLVAETVPHRVVDVLEVVQIEKKHRHDPVFATLQDVVEQREEMSAIRQACQWIAFRKLRELTSSFFNSLLEDHVLVLRVASRCQQLLRHGVERLG